MPIRRASGSTKPVGPATSMPSTAMRPADGRSTPAMRRRSVDLPEPDGPSTQTISPRVTVIESCSRATTGPYCARTPSSSSVVLPAAGRGSPTADVLRLSLTIETHGNAISVRRVGLRDLHQEQLHGVPFGVPAQHEQQLIRAREGGRSASGVFP